MELDILKQPAATEVGSYFVANYPPFSAWKAEHVAQALALLKSEVRRAKSESAFDLRSSHLAPPPLGLYLHIPFCRKRCKFCYFRVYTDKNARDIDVYMDALAREVALYADRPRFAGRQFDFVYFGGGTPSYLSNEQLLRLVERINEHWRWDAAREVTFECEPGTLKKSKVAAIKSIGVTRLSLGVEHFDDELLEINGRAHRSAEVFRAYDWIRDAGFAQVNIDLIAGMVGETEAKWCATVAQALKLLPDSVTIYQMELPHNTVISREAKSSGHAAPVADWATKRRWVGYAFEQFEAAGYAVSSGYTLVRKPLTPTLSPSTGRGVQDMPTRTAVGMAPARKPLSPALSPSTGRGSEKAGAFVYRDALWHGGDMLGTGVASFSHVGGVHFQNEDQWESYLARIDADELPLARALPLTPKQALIRELILQLKLGRIDAAYFREKFGVEIVDAFGPPFDSLVAEGRAVVDGDSITLTRAGLLRVDELLPRFFEPEFRGVRYT